VIDKVMLKDTVDHKFTTAQDVAEAALFLASFNSNALTGQSLEPTLNIGQPTRLTPYRKSLVR
jgi:3-hydroxybutyrate dehydrogenase